MAKAKRDFNTVCLADHATRCVAARPDYIKRLIAHGADVDMVKQRCKQIMDDERVSPKEKRAMLGFLETCEAINV